MTIFDKMESMKADFTRSEAKIYQGIMDNLESIESYTIVQTSEFFGVSKSAIMRFCQKLGYSGYSEFRFDFIKDLHGNAFSEGSDIEAPPSIRNRVVDTYLHAIEEMKKVDENAYLQLVQLISRFRKIRLIGIGKSNLPCRLMQHSFIRFDKDMSVYDLGVILNDLPKITNKDDLIIIFSVSGDLRTNAEHARLFKEAKATVVLVTFNPKPKSEKYADLMIVLPRLLADKKATLGAHPLFLIFVETLTAYYVEQMFSSKSRQ